MQHITKPVKAVFTSSSKSELPENLEQLGIDYVVCSALVKSEGYVSKVELLAKTIAEHYSNKGEE